MITPTTRRRAAGATVLIAAAIAGMAPPAAAAERQAERLPGRYVVVYGEGVHRADRATDRRERMLGFRARHRFRTAIKGFAARLSSGQLRALRRDPNVAFVAPDRPVRATGALAAGDSAPTGVRRIAAATGTTVHEASGSAVAVIDTGIDLGHADLGAQVAGGVNCIDATASPHDDHGHGTHVAGTIAAANDGSGVVGVAPGTRLYAVKVLDARGAGSTSSVICGIDWVTRNAAALGIGVANMSLGGLGDPVRACDSTTDPQHLAICRSTAGGVVYAVAAGNSGWDFDYAWQPDVPAAYPQVVTVTAMADTDGASGAAGASCDGAGDDRYAAFSNFAATSAGAAHAIAAPGVCVTSARLGGGTTTMSGTSMATPHIAGALALCLSEGSEAGPCAGLPADQPAGWIDALTANRTDAAYGFVGDPHRPLSGRSYGHLGWAPPVGAEAPTEPSPSPATITLSGHGFKHKGVHYADLSWTGTSTATHVDVYRDGRKVADGTANDGAHRDRIGKGGSGTYVYRVCEAGTTACSNEVAVSVA